MEVNAYLRRGKVGIPKKVIFKIGGDGLSIEGKDGTVLPQTSFANLSEVGRGFGFVAFMVGEEKYSLEFIQQWKKFFGVVGLLLLSRKANKLAKDIAQIFEQNGLAVKKRRI